MRGVFDFEPGVIDAARALPLGEVIRAGNLVSHTRGQKWAKDHWIDTIFLTPPLHKC